MQFIGKMLRQDDQEAIAAALGTVSGVVDARAVLLQQVERWRTRILDEGDQAIAEFAEAFPAADRQRLRTVTRQISAAPPESDKAKRARKELFKLMRTAAEE